MKDFSRPRVPIQFSIDDDTFDCAMGIPARTLMDMTTEFMNMDGEDPKESIAAMMEVLQKFLLPRSYERFAERMASQENPIEFPQVNEVIMWLMGEYGMRPTRQSSDSAGGLPNQEPGTALTGTTPVAESISYPSPLLNS
jgi:hypothetical protein